MSDNSGLSDPSFLMGLEHPARYLGCELGARPNRLPDHKGRLLTVALAFPDVYEIAHSHLGHKILYHLINSTKGLSAERVYAPWLDLEERLKQTGQPLRSLESSSPLNSFDLVGFSLQYELGYTNILNMLVLGQINPLASLRSSEAPLIAAGGPGASNPEPLASFFDLFFLGDAEASFIEDLEIIKQWRFAKAPKSELFELLSGRAGIYIPSLFKPCYEKGRLISIEPLKKGYEKVVRAVAPKLCGTPFPTCQITPFIKPVHDRVVVEISRGCSRGCRFCQAGFIYRPVRERPAKEVLGLIANNLKATGQDEAAFLSLSAGDHTQIEAMVEEFMDLFEPNSVALSLPSLRVGSLSDNLAKQIKRVRKTGFTIAPEAATSRLRAVINKDLTEEDIFKAAEVAFRLGWRTLKLYFMCGLPTETDEDLQAIVELVKKLKRLSKAKINLGISHFTPKAHTPFQWHRGSFIDQIQARLSVVKQASHLSGLTVRYNDPGASFVEALISRGDRRLGQLILEVYNQGARFEAWNDHFFLDHWLSAIKKLDMDIEQLLCPKDLSQCLPWEHLFCGVNRQYLADELSNALSAKPTPDCRQAGCLGCGACHDQAKIDLAAPLASNNFTEQSNSPEKWTSKNHIKVSSTSQGTKGPQPLEQARYLARFAKQGPLIFIGHLEMVEVFKRAFRRSGFNLVMSQGFHPQPRLSFLTALPLGVASLDECLLFSLPWPPVNPQQIYQNLDLPSGLRLTGPPEHLSNQKKVCAAAASWEIVSSEPVFQTPPLHLGAHLSYTDTKGVLKNFDLGHFVAQASAVNSYTAHLTIRQSDRGTPKPLAVASKLWGLETNFPAKIIKLATILNN